MASLMKIMKCESCQIELNEKNCTLEHNMEYCDLCFTKYTKSFW